MHPLSNGISTTRMTVCICVELIPIITVTNPRHSKLFCLVRLQCRKSPNFIPHVNQSVEVILIIISNRVGPAYLMYSVTKFHLFLFPVVTFIAWLCVVIYSNLTLVDFLHVSPLLVAPSSTSNDP